MALKPPQYAIQMLFSRVVPEPEEVRTSGSFLMRGKCPLCGDYKKRMYIKEQPDHYHIYCHNCGYSNGFEYFLKDEFPSDYELLREYIIDSVRTGKAFQKKKIQNPVSIPKYKVEENDLKLNQYMNEMSFCISEPQTHSSKEKCRNKCVEYCVNRKIDESIWSEFRFFIKGPLKGYIGIPMWNETKTLLLHIQGRLLIKNKKISNQQKYLFLKDVDYGIDNIQKPLYGLWRVDKSKTVYINEGTLDAPAYGEQGIATCGATISSFFINKIKKQFPHRVWCADNFWNDQAGRKLTERLLGMGESCFIIPPKMKSKDGNNLLDELNVEIIPLDFISKHTYKGRLGLAKLKIIQNKIN